MSAPMKLTPDQLRSLAEALDRLTDITAKTGVEFGSYGQLSANIGDNCELSVTHDGERYIINDVNGY